MREIFDVIGRFRDWIRSLVPDPQRRIYNTHIMIAIALVVLTQEGVPTTRSELIRLTGMSSSSIYRSTGQLEEIGIIKRGDDGAWTWVLDVPNDIANMRIALNHTGVEELKTLIITLLSSRASVPNDDEQIASIVEKVEQFAPSTKHKTGPASIFGDAVLEED